MKILVLADPALCEVSFEDKILRLCKAGADGIVLRAKHLDEIEYHKLAVKIAEICLLFQKEFIVNHFTKSALTLKSSFWLTSYNLEKNLNEIKKEKLKTIYAPAHDLTQAEISSRVSDVLIASHIYKTASKPNLEPKGVEFIRLLKSNFKQEIYALGGINERNFKECIRAGASGICVMRDAMRCENERAYFNGFGKGD